ncbi:Single-stranded nucleic acid binding R3H protein [Rhynchospora pubera]|uniref:Single-stranded nucleic acid binding R3H protein n=1 Tax=Rhynchospora pubera TaxID=906938 RepID=A0AAV8E5M8_9POAL|nr:Single-stranded nucleic acid binding R3H protein [Rhynchospora pubera]
MDTNHKEEDPAAPDSWETADLDDSVNRLFISSRNATSPSPDSDPPPPPPLPPPMAAASPPGQTTEEAVSQVDQFLREALEKPRERISVLRMEQDIERLIRNPSQMQIEFTALPTSYLRLAAHRLAQHYSLQSIAIPDPITLDGSGPGSRIIIRKISSDCRFPAVRLADIPVNLPQEDTSSVPMKLAIKPRPQRHLHGSGYSTGSSRSNLQKSVEERKEEYNRARARIFSNSNINDANSSGSSGTVCKPREEPRLPDNLDNCGFLEPELDEAYELASDLHSSSSSNSTLSGNRGGNSGGNSSRNKGEKEVGITRTRSGGSRVAIFRDRDIDRKDPDYDRSYDRYVKRFDPGFGFNGGSYPMQPLYVPAVNYNTEFPQLGSAPRPPHQLSIDAQQQARPVSPHMHGGPWSSVAPPPPQQVGQLTMAYHRSPPPEMIAHAFNASSPIGGGGVPGVRTPVYLHSPQYAMSGRPGVPISYVPSHEHMQPFLPTQQQQQQQEGSYGLARPR